MSKKNKKHGFSFWKRRNFQERFAKDYPANVYDYDYMQLWKPNCHKAKWVNITPDIKVFCGMPDQDTKKACRDEIDVFFALSWGEYQEWNKNNFYNRFKPIQKFFDREELHDMAKLIDSNPSNIADAYIPEGGIDENIALIIEKTVLKGARVGFGCAGGHGRTGWVLARLLHTIGGHPLGDDLIKLTRDLLCKNAIESEEQITNLGGTISFLGAYSYRFKDGKWVSTPIDSSTEQKVLPPHDRDDEDKRNDYDKKTDDEDPCSDPFYSNDACRGIDVKRYI
jgi:hypothetical protein